MWWPKQNTPEEHWRTARRDPANGSTGEGVPDDSCAVSFGRERLGFEADELQATVLRSQSGCGILNCSRQWGKSTVTAVKAVHRAYTVRRSALILVASSDAAPDRGVPEQGEEVGVDGFAAAGSSNAGRWG